VPFQKSVLLFQSERVRRKTDIDAEHDAQHETEDERTPQIPVSGYMFSENGDESRIEGKHT